MSSRLDALDLDDDTEEEGDAVTSGNEESIKLRRSAPADGAGSDEVASEELLKKKRKQMVKPFNEELLTNTDGLSRIYEFSKKMKFRGRGHEVDDVKLLMKVYREWAFQLHPGLAFTDVLARCETLGSKARVRHHMSSLRDKERERYLTDLFGPETAKKMVYNQNQRTPIANTAAVSTDVSDEPETSPEADSPFEAHDGDDVASGDYMAASRGFNTNASMQQYSQEASFADDDDEDDALMQAVQEAEERYLREKAARESVSAATSAVANGGELSFIVKDGEEEQHMEEFLTAQQHSQEYSQFDDADDDMDTDALHQHSQPNSPVNSPLNVLSYRAISHTQQDGGGDNGELFSPDSPLSLPNPRRQRGLSPSVACTDIDLALTSKEDQLDDHTQGTQDSNMEVDSEPAPAPAPMSLSPISRVSDHDVTTLSATAPTQVATQLATQLATQIATQLATQVATQDEEEEGDEEVNEVGAVAVVDTSTSGVVVDAAAGDADAGHSPESNAESAQEDAAVVCAAVVTDDSGEVEKEREEEQEEEEEVFAALVSQSQSTDYTTQHPQQHQEGEVSDTLINNEIASDGVDRVSAVAAILSPARTLVGSGHPVDDFADTLVDDEVLVALTQLASP